MAGNIAVDETQRWMKSYCRGLSGIDEIARVNATQNDRDMIEGAGNNAGEYLNCTQHEMKKWRNLTVKVTKPSWIRLHTLLHSLSANPNYKLLVQINHGK